MAGYRRLALDDIATVRFSDPDVPSWKPVRRELGAMAFGTNAYVGDAGELVIERHDELPDGDEPAHQELYLVLAGRARFQVGGEQFELGPGELVFIDDPALVRTAHAVADGTVIFTVGGPVGAPFSVSEWEERFLSSGARDGD